MIKPRVVDKDEGIPEGFTVEVYNRMIKNLRVRGWIETDLLIKNGVNRQLSPEIGLGFKYLGLGWLKKNQRTWLQGLKINPNDSTR